MLSELDCRERLENTIRLQIRTAQRGEDTSKYAEQIHVYQAILEYDDFTISVLTNCILRQEERH